MTNVDAIPPMFSLNERTLISSEPLTPLLSNQRYIKYMNPEPTNPEPTNPEPTNPEPTNPEPTILNTAIYESENTDLSWLNPNSNKENNKENNNPYIFTKIDWDFIDGNFIIDKNNPKIFNACRKLRKRELISKIRYFPYWYGMLLKKPYMQREFIFLNNSKASEFIYNVNELANTINHFPKISLLDNKVNIVLRTSEVDGITNKDIMLAHLINSSEL